MRIKLRAGLLSGDNVGSLHLNLTDLCGTHRTHFAAIDLSEVQKIAASAVQRLVVPFEYCRKAGGRLVLFAPQPPVIEALERADLPWQRDCPAPSWPQTNS